MKLFKVLLFLATIIPLSGCSTNSSIDYSKADNWLKICGTPTKEYDTFYVLPTSWAAGENDGAYCEIDNASLRSKAPYVYSLQAQVLESISNVYAPYYRQVDATLLSSKNVPEMNAMVYDNVPYYDVIDAFEYYLQHYNAGRPFILAGHSQGSMIIKNILQKYMVEHPEVYQKMIAAYPLGYSYEQSYFDDNVHLKFANNAGDPGVVVTWNSEMKLEGDKFGTYNLVVHGGALAINPISWSNDAHLVDASDARNLGSDKLPGLKFSTQVQYDFARHAEVLIVGTSDTSYLSPLGDASLHSYDWTFFLNNIKENVALRAANYLALAE